MGSRHQTQSSCDQAARSHRQGHQTASNIYSQTEDDRVMVTARFWSAPRPKMRSCAYMRRSVPTLIASRRHSRAADCRSRHQRCSDCRLTLSPKPEATRPLERQGSLRAGRQAPQQAYEGRRCRSHLHFGRPRRRSASNLIPRAITPWRHFAALVAKVRDANRSFLAGQVRERRDHAQCCGWETLTGIPDIGLLLITTRDGRPVYVNRCRLGVIGPSPREASRLETGSG